MGLAELGGLILQAAEVLEVPLVLIMARRVQPTITAVAMVAEEEPEEMRVSAARVDCRAAAAVVVAAMVAAAGREVLAPRELYASGPGKKYLGSGG